MIVGGLAIIILVAEGLIYLFYGRESAMFGLGCILLGLSPLLLIAIILWLIELVVKRADNQS
jgi:hypothetical protein